MAISFPTNFPTVTGNGAAAINGARITMEAWNVVAGSISPYTLQEQTYLFQGSMWKLSVSLPLMTRAQAAPFQAWLVGQSGKYGTFLYGPPDNTGLLGSASGSVTVNGASQGGRSLIVASLSGTLKAGDYFSVGTGANARLYMNLVDKTGAGTLDIFPALDISPSNGAAVTMGATAKGCFRLAANSVQWDVSEGYFYSLSFEAYSAI